MKKLNKKNKLTVNLDAYSVYKMKGSDKIIIRRKGGPTGEQVQTSDRYVRTRENQAEFKGVGLAARAIRQPLYHVKGLSDYNFTSQLIRCCSKIKTRDKTGERGQRGVLLSQHRYMLAGFTLHSKHPFNSIVASPVNCILNREAKSAVIQLPMLTPDFNLRLPWKYPLYRFSMSLGLVSDTVYQDGQYNVPPSNYIHTPFDTAWQVATEPFQSQTIELKLQKTDAIKDSETLLFAIGIEMGINDHNGEVQEVKRAGSACILALG